jgi:hypothetical protein
MQRRILLTFLTLFLASCLVLSLLLIAGALVLAFSPEA